MLIRHWLTTALAFLPACRAIPSPFMPEARGEPLQNIVTWDDKSLFINGERLMIMSGEFHPFRVPNAGLWLDVLQKVAALGFNTVSFYCDWAQLEGKPGDFSAEGIFALDELFDAAKRTGIYLIARPGPYINAESSGGGMPGWVQRIPGHYRTNATGFMDAAKRYLQNIGPLVAKGQITNGGPVILVQPENEYSRPAWLLSPDYMQMVQDTLREAGVVVPLISDDSKNYGFFTPGSGVGEHDIYGHNAYPLAFDCKQPEVWTGLPNQYFPTDWWNIHMQQSPSSPFSVLEMQAGSLDSWGGPGFDKCAAMANHEFERVFYKQVYGFGARIFNVYMLAGATNWGNLGHSYGYTSYDYGAAIKEDRTVTREKYSELKLQANFLMASPSFLVATPQNQTNGTYTSSDQLNMSPVLTNSTGYWVVRHAFYDSKNTTRYQLTLPTSAGNITIPQICGSLQLVGRDSKIFVTDYPVGDLEVLYSTLEVFTWQQYEKETVLVLFGGPEPLNEIAFKTSSKPETLEGKVRSKTTEHGTVVQWRTSSQRAVFRIDGVTVYIMDRNSAYDLWVFKLPKSGNDYPTAADPTVIVNAGYLVRNATVSGSTLHLTGDVNATTTLEVLGAPAGVESVTWNSQPVTSSKSPAGALTATLDYTPPELNLPDLYSLSWKTIDSLPEAQPTYDDSLWRTADLSYTNNTMKFNLSAHVSLFGSDYGLNTGAMIFRGHFKGNGKESTIQVMTKGGDGSCSALWLNGRQLDAWYGDGNEDEYKYNVTVGALEVGTENVLMVVVDQNGYDQSGSLESNMFKNPRGILNYNIDGHEDSDVTWKVTGNLGGEDYQDRVRGPLNEGGLFAERQGYHLPGAPTESWQAGSPKEGLEVPGIAFYAATFDLAMPDGWDIPLSFVFDNSTWGGASRVQFFVNGWHYGKYAPNLGPQLNFPVHEGILNYNGPNYLAVILWALEEDGARIPGLKLEPSAMIKSGLGRVPLSPEGRYVPRPHAY